MRVLAKRAPADRTLLLVQSRDFGASRFVSGLFEKVHCCSLREKGKSSDKSSLNERLINSIQSD